MKGMKIGIDFGSSSIKIYAENKGIVVNEPSIAAISVDSRQPIAFGKAADDMLGRCGEEIEIVQVIQNGVISDFVLAEKMLRFYLEAVCGNRVYKPNVMICLSSNATSFEKKTFLDAVTLAGAGRVCLVEGILASAFGCNVDAEKIGGRMVLDIGHHVTEFAIISMGSLAGAGTINRGSYDIDCAVERHLKRDRDILVGPHTIREIKNKITSAISRDCETALFISGKSNLDEMPISFEITSNEIYPFVDEQISLLVSEINDAMQNIPPELLADAADHGICICGGGSLIFDIAQRLDEETNIRCEVVDEPTLAKVKGLGKLLKNDKLLEENGYRFIFKDEIREKIRRLDSKNI